MVEKIANHLRSLGYEEVLAAAELLLFQLMDILDLILTDHKQLFMLIFTAKVHKKAINEADNKEKK